MVFDWLGLNDKQFPVAGSARLRLQPGRIFSRS